MSWGIAETAPEIEKIKAESADYLGGLNSCGEIEWGIYSQAFDFYADLIQKAYELGKTEAKPHWIPVTERLPEASESVMICDAYGDICIGHRTMGGYYFPDFCDDKIKDVRAWAELPEPYKGVTE